MVFTKEELRGGEVRFRYTTRARFQDADPAGIVFFARFFDFTHDAYAELLRARGLPLERVLAGAYGLPLRHAEADYLRPLRSGDVFEVQLVAARAGERDVSFGWRIASADGTQVYAVVSTVHAAIDTKAFKGIGLPQEVREALGELLAG